MAFTNTPCDRGAILDPSGTYRYRLWRSWDPTLPRVTFVLLNPSTADATRDDATLRRCWSFARSWGAGGCEIVNLFALRTPDPLHLRNHPHPIGPDNDRHLAQAIGTAQILVAGWGNGGALGARDRTVLSFFVRRAYCLGMTGRGQPRHPLYVPGCTPLVPLISGG
ncbi:DUF1643 domain-containing protein [Anthocerotibacter panamensis]|uniref:DUF1643 domain-containing protein n=1 Tax=Anthocerotibacter panamensis TaxID=2857077 RepID=UPI001C4034E0|nr:DUF1643 domain-containing protein [Anthocerotibacter panamensis]